MDNPPSFASVRDECSFWKEKAISLYKQYTEVTIELEEFTNQSHQLEAELETSLEQREKKCKDLTQTLYHSQHEIDTLRTRLDIHQDDLKTIDQQCRKLISENENYKIYIRELEQKNDDLERAHRIVSENVAGFETLLNEAYERNALLEMEVDEKEQLQTKLQRMMDEARDMKQELKIRKRTSIRPADLDDYPPLNGSSEQIQLTTKRQQTELQTQNQLHTGLTTERCDKCLNNVDNSNLTHSECSPINDCCINSTTPNDRLTPSAKSKALNVIAEMLRKVNEMEVRLSSYKETKRLINYNSVDDINNGILNNITAAVSPRTDKQCQQSHEQQQLNQTIITPASARLPLSMNFDMDEIIGLDQRT